MLTIKLIKYANNDNAQPSHTETVSLRQANAVHLRFEEDGRQVLQLGDAPGDTMELTVGPRKDCSYSIAYVMNEAGKTVEVIR